MLNPLDFIPWDVALKTPFGQKWDRRNRIRIFLPFFACHRRHSRNCWFDDSRDSDKFRRTSHTLDKLNRRKLLQTNKLKCVKKMIHQGNNEWLMFSIEFQLNFILSKTLLTILFFEVRHQENQHLSVSLY